MQLRCYFRNIPNNIFNQLLLARVPCKLSGILDAMDFPDSFTPFPVQDQALSPQDGFGLKLGIQHCHDITIHKGTYFVNTTHHTQVGKIRDTVVCYCFNEMLNTVNSFITIKTAIVVYPYLFIFLSIGVFANQFRTLVTYLLLTKV